MNTPQNLTLPDRAILAIEAPTLSAAQTFLQPLCTQNVTNFNAALKQPTLRYTLFLTPQGRLLADAFTFPHPQETNMLCLDVHHSQLMPIAQRLNGYILGQPIALHNLTAHFTVTTAFHNTENPAKGITGQGGEDPRHPNMGQRHYTFYTTEHPVTHNTETSDCITYHTHRITQGIPDPAYDAPPAKALPAELGLQHLNAIDFNKGCYVGQEVTARLHFRSAAKKQLYIVHNERDATPRDKTQQNDTPTRQNAPPTPHTRPLLKPNTTTEVGWLGKPFNNKCLAVIQTRIDPQIFTNLTLKLPTYLSRAIVEK